MTDLKQFGVEYRHNGASWFTTFHAEDIEDARRKFRSMTTNGEVQGPVYTAPVPGFVPDWLATFVLNMVCGVLNLWAKIRGK